MEITMKIEVTTARGGVVLFESMGEMFEFAKNYAAKHRMIPKGITVDGKPLDVAGRMIICEMTYLIKTAHGETYCLTQKDYKNFLALVAVGARKAPKGVSKLIDKELGSMMAYTAMFDQDVEGYIRHSLTALAVLTPEQRVMYEAEVAYKKAKAVADDALERLEALRKK